MRPDASVVALLLLLACWFLWPLIAPGKPTEAHHPLTHDWVRVAPERTTREAAAAIDEVEAQVDERLAEALQLIEELQSIADLVPPGYRLLVVNTAREFDLDPRLLASVGYVESRWRAGVAGADGEVGPMQIMPTTAAWIAEQKGMGDYDLYDPRTNVRMGAWYLRHLLDSQPDEVAALAAYNGGPRWAERAPTQTRAYAHRVLSVMNQEG